MPSLWDYLHLNQSQNKRNLEEGLFQIASQTCNILVKVNNTNNINLTRSNSDEYGCAGPPKGKSSMQICVPKFRKNSITSGCNPGLSVSLKVYFSVKSSFFTLFIHFLEIRCLLILKIEILGLFRKLIELNL